MWPFKKKIKVKEIVRKDNYHEVEIYFVGQAKNPNGELIACYAATKEGDPFQMSIHSLEKVGIWLEGGATWLDMNEVNDE